MSKKRKKRRYYRRKKRQNTNIYEIKAGKGSNTYYYIGKANNPYTRLEAHKDKALNNIGKNERKNRIFRQNIGNLKMRVLEKPRMTQWRTRERHWIAKYRQKYGYKRVLNASDGGDGHSGGGWDDHKPVTSPVTTFLALIFTAIFLCSCLYLLS